VGVGPLNLSLDPAWRKRKITKLLAGQRSDGGFGVHPYSKWTGSHWRLVSLVELGVSSNDRAAHAAAEDVLRWIAAPSKPLILDGRERRHASMEGNAVAVCCRLGMAKDPRVRHLVDVLLSAQWPDGGWNCDRIPQASHSSFHESVAPIWGLVEYHRATGDRGALESANRAGELLLGHHIYVSSTSRQPIHAEWTHIHWPHYWHYDFFHGLRAVALLGRLADPRASEALAYLRSLRHGDGTWRTGGRRYWNLPGRAVSAEVVDWGDAHEIVTPAAMAMLS
jgi:hypothetical protein